MNHQSQGWPGWTVVLRRRPARIVAGRPEGGYTDEWEIICCDCGDDPGLDYREVIPALQRIRGPYPIAVGITAYVEHARRHPTPQGIQAAVRCAGEPAAHQPPARLAPDSGARRAGAR